MSQRRKPVLTPEQIQLELARRSAIRRQTNPDQRDTFTRLQDEFMEQLVASGEGIGVLSFEDGHSGYFRGRQFSDVDELYAAILASDTPKLWDFSPELFA